jgi:hypothetical protein
MGDQSPCDWEALKPEIKQLYLVENKSLMDVLTAIKAAHNIPILKYGFLRSHEPIGVLFEDER